MHRPLVLAFVLCSFCMTAWSHYRIGEKNGLPGEARDESRAQTSRAPSFSAQATVKSIPGSGLSFPPTVANPIPNQEVSVTAGPFEIDLDQVFSSSDGDALRYSTLINNPQVARVEIVERRLRITPYSIGDSRVRVTATDNDDDRVSDFFTLVVRANQPPRVIFQSALSDQIMIQGGSPFSLNLLTVFDDPDDDPLEFSASSSNPEVSQPVITDNVLQISPVGAGESTITLKVDDTRGASIDASFRVAVIRAYPGQITTQVAIPFENPDDQASYRMVGLPGDQVVPIMQIANGLPARDWIAYAADSSLSGNLVPFDGSPFFELRPGKGLWFLQKKPWILGQQTVVTVPLSSTGAYAIPLHPGWNIISNPFDVPVPWEDVAARNGLSQALWRWEGVYVAVDTFYSALNGGEAFYYNNLERKEAIELPYPGIASPLPSKKGAGQVAPLLEVTAVWKGERRASLEFGLQLDARDGLDHFDQFAPPPHFADIGFVIEGRHPEFEASPLAREVRLSGRDLHIVPLKLYADEGAYIRLIHTGAANLPHQRILLVNKLESRVYDLRTTASINVYAESRETPFELVVGDSARVRVHIEGLTPQDAFLKQNYPNPFHLGTTIEYTVPEFRAVTLQIFDLLGRHVITLVDGHQEAGLYRVTWDGRDKADARVASGLYLYRFKAGQTLLSKKLIVQ